MKNLWLARQSVPQICFGSYFQKGKIFRFGKESIFPFRENHPLSEDTKIKLSLCMLLVFGASKNVSFNNNNHVSKLFAKGFENLSSSFFFSVPKIYYISSIEQRTWLHLYFPFGSFIPTLTTRWQIIMALLFYIKQILILVMTVFVEMTYLSGDLKTINCQP